MPREMEVRAEMDTRSSGIIVRLGFCLEPGQSTMTPEELGRWVTSVYEDARQLLLQRMASGDAARRCLLRHGWRHWEPPATQEQFGGSFFPEELDELPETIAQPDAEPAQAFIDPVLPPSPPVDRLPEPPALQAHPSSRRIKPPIQQTPHGKKVLALLKRATQSLDKKEIQKQAGLTQYYALQAVDKLVEAGLVIEEFVEIGGRWGSKAVYRLA